MMQVNALTAYKCDDCFAPATYKGTRPESIHFLEEYYCDDCMEPLTKGFDITVTPLPARPKSAGYMALLPADGRFTEDDLWDAIAEANGMDASEIMDGDLAEWL